MLKATHLSALSLLLLFLAACGQPEPTATNSPVPTPTPTATPMPTATPWTLSPKEAAAIDEDINSVIDIARTRMAALRTAHYSIGDEGQGSKLESDVRFPYEVRGVITGSGDPEEVGLLLTKGKAFTGNPNGSCWSERSTPFAIVVIFGLDVVSPILQAQLDLTDSIRNLEHVPDETAGTFYHVRFDIDWPLWFTFWVQGLDQAIGEETADAMYPAMRNPEGREAMLSGGIQGTAYEGEVWIDKETLRVHRFLWEQASTLTGLPQYTWDVTVSRFDQAVPEVPDLGVIASVGPCTEDGRPRGYDDAYANGLTNAVPDGYTHPYTHPHGYNPFVPFSTPTVIETKSPEDITAATPMPTFEPVACLIGQGAPSDVGVDQSNEAPWDGASTNIAPENGVEQSFRPFKFPLIAVAVEITSGSGHVGVDTITMNIIGEDEAILASSSIDVCFSFQGWIRFLCLSQE